MLPMLASDYLESKLRFPLLVQPKVDGVRGLNLNGVLTGRSLKTHANKHTTALYSNPMLIGFDGELAAERATHPDLCRLTTSALSTIEGQPFTQWHLFDYVTPESKLQTYEQRFDTLVRQVELIHIIYPHFRDMLRIIPSTPCASLERLYELEEQALNDGYEGLICRDPTGLYKEGRSTPREGGLLRIKRFADFEVEIVEIFEGVKNTNEAQENELGRQFRSSHQENLVPNGMVGAMMGRVLADVKDARGQLLFAKDSLIKFSAGKLSHVERIAGFVRQDLLLGKIAKVQCFMKGVKDKPRFPTFQSLRTSSDLAWQSAFSLKI